MKGNGIEKSVVETKSGNGEYSELIDLSTSSRGQTKTSKRHSLLSFRAGTACALEGINKKITSTFIPLNEGESEERAGGACAKRPFSFKTGLGRKSTHGPLKTNYGKLAFTLVELIVVIVILGVLATVGFLAFQDYPKQARDVVRISNLKEIEKSINLHKIKNGDYPLPTNSRTGTIDGFSGTWYIGSFGEELANQIEEITKTPLDPKTKTGYYYALREDKMNYRIIADLEETGKKYIVANMIHTSTNTETASGLRTIIGNDIVGRRYSDNTYATSCNEYRNPTNTNYSYDGSIGDGIYLIKIDVNHPAFFQVYCDMTTDGGGWTKIVGNSLYSNGNFPFSPNRSGVNFDYTGGKYESHQGNSPSGHCFYPSSDFNVIIPNSFSELRYKFTCDWYNAQPEYGYDIGNNGTNNYYINLSSSYGYANTATIEETKTDNFIGNTKVFFSCNSCQRISLPNYLKIDYLIFR